MRRSWVAEAEGLERLRWGSSGRGVVGPVVVESVREGVDKGLELIDTAGQVVGGVELVAPGGLGALDAAVEVGPLLR